MVPQPCWFVILVALDAKRECACGAHRPLLVSRDDDPVGSARSSEGPTPMLLPASLAPRNRPDCQPFFARTTCTPSTKVHGNEVGSSKSTGNYGCPRARFRRR